MAFPGDLVDLLFGASLAEPQVWGLFFLLGSFTVATVSDLKHMSAQREFVEVWFAFALAMLLVEFVFADGGRLTTPFLVKWGLVVLLSVMSHRRVGPLFRLATGDVAACAAAASLLAPGWVLLYFGLLKLVDLPLGPLLARGRDAYPFMPVVTLGTVGVLGLAWAFEGLF